VLLVLTMGLAAQDGPGNAEEKEAGADSDSLATGVGMEEAVPGNGTAEEEQSLSLELSGLIVDETQTKIGRDFYEYFYSNWTAPGGVREYTIVISEKPLPQRGTQVTVTVNDLDVYQAFLQPRLEVIEENVFAALQRTGMFLKNYREVVRSLQGDDMEGTGIY
jgi:curli production assembly/transport component CsgE